MEGAQTAVQALRGCGLRKGLREIAERFWESRPERVKAPYVKAEGTEQDPEYCETRGTLQEIRGTTP